MQAAPGKTPEQFLLFAALRKKTSRSGTPHRLAPVVGQQVRDTRPALVPNRLNVSFPVVWSPPARTLPVGTAGQVRAEAAGLAGEEE